jgi:hypothetical protein
VVKMPTGIVLTFEYLTRNAAVNNEFRWEHTEITFVKRLDYVPVEKGILIHRASCLSTGNWAVFFTYCFRLSQMLSLHLFQIKYRFKSQLT